MNSDAYKRIHNALKRGFIYSDVGEAMYYNQGQFCGFKNDHWIGCIGGFVCVALGYEPVEINEMSFGYVQNIVEQFFEIESRLAHDLLINNDAGCIGSEAADVLRILYQTGVVNWNFAMTNDKISKLIEENDISIEDLENFLARP